MKDMIAIITGDIINSRKGNINNWMNILKTALNYYGESPKQWEIFRGDSFQLQITPNQSIVGAFHIKAMIKQKSKQDVRIAIGLGVEEYCADRITEANGSAYVNSGECFDTLKKHTLAIKSANEEFDTTINIMLQLATLTANNWSKTVAETITTILEHPDKNQNEIAKMLNKSQSNVSAALKRSGFEEIMKLNSYYQSQLAKL